LDGLGFTDGAISNGVNDSVAFIELDLIDLHLAQQGGRQGLELLGGFHQPVQDGMGIDLEDSRGAADTQSLGETGDAMDNKVVCFRSARVKFALQRPPVILK
jgi:hypothetical protein